MKKENVHTSHKSRSICLHLFVYFFYYELFPVKTKKNM